MTPRHYHKVARGCLLFWAMGWNMKEIAQSSGLTLGSVYWRIRCAQRELGVFGEANVTRWAIKNRLIGL